MRYPEHATRMARISIPVPTPTCISNGRRDERLPVRNSDPPHERSRSWPLPVARFKVNPRTTGRSQCRAYFLSFHERLLCLGGSSSRQRRVVTVTSSALLLFPVPCPERNTHSTQLAWQEIQPQLRQQGQTRNPCLDQRLLVRNSDTAAR